MVVKRLVLTFKPEEIIIHALYRSDEPTGNNSNTKARTRHVTDLTRRGLQEALEALQDGSPECVGTSGFTQREDILLATTSPDAQKLVKGA
jgi:hypothetical protein